MLVFLHGPSGCAAEWNAVRAHLPPSLRLNCFAPELDFAGLTPDQIAADVRAHLAPRDLARLVIVSHGVAGGIALRLADMADQLALVAPPVDVDAALVPSHPKTGEIWIDGLAHKPEVIQHFDFHRMVARQQIGALMVEGVASTPLARLRREAETLFQHPALREDHVSVIIGAEDRIAPADKLRAYLPGDRLHVLPGAGHLLALEVPQNLAAHLSRAHGAVSPWSRTPSEVSIAS